NDDGAFVKATFLERVMFGFEGFTAVLMVGTTLLFFQPFCTGVLGLAPAAPALIYSVVMVVDAFTDPVFGVFVDKYRLVKSRKYTPWYYLGVIILCLGVTGVFWNPALKTATAMTVFVLVMYLFQTFGNTFITVSIGPMRSVIATDPGQRSTLPAFSSIPALLASVFVAGIPVLVKLLGDRPDSYRWLTMGFSFLSLAASLLVVFSLGKRDKTVISGESFTIRDMWEALKANKPLQMLIIADTTNTLASGMVAASAIYFYKYVINDINLEIQPIVSLIGIFTGLVGAFVAAVIAKKLGRKAAYVLGTWIAIGVASVLLLFRPFGNIFVFVPIMSLGSVFGGLVGNTKWVMIADCVDYGYWKSGKSAPAVYNSIFSFVGKLSLAISGTLIAAILSMAGFQDNSLPQKPPVVAALIAITFLFPILGHIASILSMRHYEIDSELYEKMTRENAQRIQGL
ncbi:MAG: MFS transporter, partial [Clostridiales bacterium]|nr:MFS transporter [Clostridiales bacterium]